MQSEEPNSRVLDFDKVVPSGTTEPLAEEVERVARALRGEERVNFNLELGDDQDVRDLARAAILALRAGEGE